MAQTTKKNKVNSLAKDLGIKGKELVDFLAAKGISDKSASASLEDSEVSLILTHYTKKFELSDISDYFALATAKKEPVAEEKAKNEEKDAKAPKAEKKEEPKAEKAEKKDEKPAPVKEAPTETAKASEKTSAPAKEPVKAAPAAPKRPAVSQAAINSAASIAQRAAALANRAGAGDKRPQQNRPNGDRPYGERNSFGDKRPGGNAPVRDNVSRFNDRFNKQSATPAKQPTEIFGKDGFVKVPAAPAPQKPKNAFDKNRAKFGKPAPGRDKDDDYGQSVRQPSIRTSRSSRRRDGPAPRERRAQRLECASCRHPFARSRSFEV